MYYLERYFNRNGAERSGLFCLCAVAIDRVNSDGYAAMPLILNNLRSRRKELVPYFVSMHFILRMSNVVWSKFAKYILIDVCFAFSFVVTQILYRICGCSPYSQIRSELLVIFFLTALCFWSWQFIHHNTLQNYF